MNHYETLGVPNTASREDIKKAYRKLSLQLHPDRNTDPSSIEKYQAINNAFEVLGDPAERTKYDMGFGENPISDMAHMFGGMGMGGIKIFTSPDISAFGFDTLPIDIENILNILHGGNIGPHRGIKPHPIEHQLTIGFDKVLTGASIPVHIERWIIDMYGKQIVDTETLYIDVPKGVDNNEVLVIPDKGHILADNTKGDVKIIFTVLNNTHFERNGLDLVYYHTISLKEALCGFTFDFTHLNGKVYSINNTGGKIIYDNYQTTLPRMGLTRNEHTGKLIIVFNVDFPTSLTATQIETIKNIL